MGIEDQSGVIDAGRRADLALFGESPLDDPDHFFAEKTVLHGGQWVQ